MNKYIHMITLMDRLHIVDNPQAQEALLHRLSKQRTSGSIGFVNAHAINLCYRDPSFYENLMRCDLLLRDGIGMKILCRLLGRRAGMNMNGTDLIPRILALRGKGSLAIYGTQKHYLKQAADTLRHTTELHVTSMLDGFHDIETYVADQQQPADIILLAMGMPKQEQLAARLSQTPSSSLIICGGAIVDFMAGKVSRAPSWVRAIGMEWCYRLALEPRRLAKRYLAGNAIFLLRAAYVSLRYRLRGAHV
ncbi:MAG: WecB/TagA/CpsF family glycosyltransferase [Sphaerospermopsis sp. SIO1G2]|nr:WecB/TagA/CpsF family glycosyltransferase [Sphaerospermopsis sp. SIO1G2]